MKSFIFIKPDLTQVINYCHATILKIKKQNTSKQKFGMLNDLKVYININMQSLSKTLKCQTSINKFTHNKDTIENLEAEFNRIKNEEIMNEI